MMKQIFDFEKNSPPIINENMLRAELEKRRLQKQLAMIVIAGVLLQCALLLCGRALYEEYPILSLLLVGYMLISLMGSAVITFVYTKKRRFAL